MRFELSFRNTTPLKNPSFLRKKILRILFGLAGAGGSLYCLFRFGRWRDLAHLPLTLVSGLAGIILLLTAIEMSCRAERLKRACRTMGATIRFWDGIWVNAIGDVFGALTPSSVGGEVSRLAALVHLKLKPKQAVKVVALERFSLLLALGFVVTLGAAVIFLRNPAAFAMPAFRYTVYIYLGIASTLLVGVLMVGLRKKSKIDWREFLLRIDLIGLGAVHHLIRLSLIPLITYFVAGSVPSLLVYVWAFVLGYGFSLVPIPSGGGSVELAFMTAFSPLVTPEKASIILVIWRLSGHYLYVLSGAFVTLIVSWLKSEKLEDVALLAEEGSKITEG